MVKPAHIVIFSSGELFCRFCIVYSSDAPTLASKKTKEQAHGGARRHAGVAMLELLAYLRANGFKTFIVSGGDVDFIRVFAERVYGIPREQIIGSSGKLQFELREGRPALVKLPELAVNNDKAAKPVAHELGAMI